MYTYHIKIWYVLRTYHNVTPSELRMGYYYTHLGNKLSVTSGLIHRTKITKEELKITQHRISSDRDLHYAYQ